MPMCNLDDNSSCSGAGEPGNEATQKTLPILDPQQLHVLHGKPGKVIQVKNCQHLWYV